MRIYLAGAMGCYESDIWKANGWRTSIKNKLIEANWREDNLHIYNPVDFYNYIHQDYQSDEEVMDFDLDLVLKSDLIIVNLTDILRSPGTITEMALAWKKGIPILGFGAIPEHPWIRRFCRRIEDSDEKLVKYIKEYYYYD